MTVALATQAAIAAHRFGLGEADAESTLRGDPRGWLTAQIGPADVQRSSGTQPLPSAAEGLRRHLEFVQQRRQRREASAAPAMGATEPRSIEQQFGEHFRQLVQADTRARLSTAALTARPFTERLALFWANHFTVSMAKASVRGLVGAFEREAIRPHIGGRFEDLLRAAVVHPAMLRYLDNDQSAGPHSQVVQRLAQRARRVNDGQSPRVTGLNENLAREVLELHTLGAAAARNGTYTQADVTAFAAVLTGWRLPIAAYADSSRGAQLGPAIAAAGADSPTRFEPAWHEPGDKTVLGRRYREGPRRPGPGAARPGAAPGHGRIRRASSWRGISWPMSRQPALVERMVQAWRATEGDLPSVYRSLLDAPEAWLPSAAKLKSPEELVLSCVRVLRLGACGLPASARRRHRHPRPARAGGALACRLARQGRRVARSRRRLEAGRVGDAAGRAGRRPGRRTRAGAGQPGAAAARLARHARSNVPPTRRRRWPCCCCRPSSNAAE